MSFVSRNILSSDERVVYATGLHWIHLIRGFLWAAAFIGIGIALNTVLRAYGGLDETIYRVEVLGRDFGPFHLWIESAFAGTGILLFLVHVAKVISTEVVLTTGRIIYKSGLIFVEVEEINLGEIEGERVRHGLLGALIGYGAVFLDCRFVGDINLPVIRNPYRFLRAVHKMRAQINHGAQGPGVTSPLAAAP